MLTPMFAFSYTDRNKPCIGIVVSTNDDFIDIDLNTFCSIVAAKEIKGLYLYKNYDCCDLNLPLSSLSNNVLDKVLKLKQKVVHSADLFKSYLKLLYPSWHLNPIYLCENSIVLDNPFVEVNGNILCKWVPLFEKKVSLSLIKQDNGCMVYHIQKPIFIFTYDYKRHTPAFNEEYFSLNAASGQCIHFWRNATLEEYIEYGEHLDGTSWVREYVNRTPITGFKLRS